MQYYTEKITLQISDKEFECSVHFSYTKGVPAYTRGHPDNWEEATPDEYEVIKCNGKYHAMDWLIEALEDEIIDKLRKLKHE